MAGPHADAEDLAQLAMQSPVSPDVAAHVAACPECTKDLSLLTSLLDAEGSDTKGASAGTADPVDVSPPLDDAMTDGNDARQSEGTGASQPRQAAAPEVPPADTGRNSGMNATALVVALLIFVGAALLAFFALR